MFPSEGMLKKPDPDSSSKVSSDGPFFTVVIPTMNRANLLAAAVRTVLWQTFDDFELIVSDNSNNHKAKAQNQAEIEKYASDSRVRYIRPDRWMNMPDHWEFATRHASGRYVVILTDRHVMRPSALEYLHLKIKGLPEESKVVCWYDHSAFNDQSGVLIDGDFISTTEVLDSNEVVRTYASLADWKSTTMWSNRLPRMLNSCYRFDVAKTIRNEHGRLFIPVSPDYTAAYLFLAYTDKIVYLDRPLFMFHGNQGNGHKGLVHGIELYASTLEGVDVFERVPLRLSTSFNTIMRDFLTVKHLVAPKFSDVNLDLAGYYMFNYRELIYRERLGSLTDINALYKQWWEGVGQLSPEHQTRIKQHVKELDRSHPLPTAFRRLAVRMGLDQSWHFLLGKIHHIFRKLAGKPTYADVFEAAIENDILIADNHKQKSDNQGGPKWLENDLRAVTADVSGLISE